jgi:hypothetical protein
VIGAPGAAGAPSRSCGHARLETAVEASFLTEVEKLVRERA